MGAFASPEGAFSLASPYILLLAQSEKIRLRQSPGVKLSSTTQYEKHGITYDSLATELGRAIVLISSNFSITA